MIATSLRYWFAAAATFVSPSVALAADLHPIVEVNTGYFFGASAEGKWIEAGRAAKSITPDTVYRVYSLTEQLGEAKGSKPKSIEEPCPDTLTVELSPKPGKGVIAIAAPWNPMPRKPRKADTSQRVYVSAVTDFLKARGIKTPKVKITQNVRVDLEGDGEEEVLISATNYFSKEKGAPLRAPAAGSYSFVMLRRVVSGKVQTQLIAGEFYPRSKESNTPNVYEVSAVLDLDGDGKLEIVVHSYYYEGGSTTIYRAEPVKAKPVLAVECGV
jgi:hypothetical protein